MTDTALPIFDAVAWLLDMVITLCWLLPLLMLTGFVIDRFVNSLYETKRAYVPPEVPVAQYSSPTRLRIYTELYVRELPCSSCGGQTREIVVVRLYDDVARVCTACAATLAPECAA